MLAAKLIHPRVNPWGSARQSAAPHRLARWEREFGS
jgi:hypothetical protein